MHRKPSISFYLQYKSTKKVTGFTVVNNERTKKKKNAASNTEQSSSKTWNHMELTCIRANLIKRFKQLSKKKWRITTNVLILTCICLHSYLEWDWFKWTWCIISHSVNLKHSVRKETIMSGKGVLFYFLHSLTPRCCASRESKQPTNTPQTEVTVSKYKRRKRTKEQQKYRIKQGSLQESTKKAHPEEHCARERGKDRKKWADLSEQSQDRGVFQITILCPKYFKVFWMHVCVHTQTGTINDLYCPYRLFAV